MKGAAEISNHVYQSEWFRWRRWKLWANPAATGNKCQSFGLNSSSNPLCQVLNSLPRALFLLISMHKCEAVLFRKLTALLIKKMDSSAIGDAEFHRERASTVFQSQPDNHASISSLCVFFFLFAPLISSLTHTQTQRGESLWSGQQILQNEVCKWRGFN